MIDRSMNRAAGSIRSIDRGLSRLTLSSSGRIRSLRQEMEAQDREERRQYEATTREIAETLSLLVTRISRSSSHPRNL